MTLVEKYKKINSVKFSFGKSNDFASNLQVPVRHSPCMTRVMV
jgi:hypothetical protein